jgi:phosphoglycerate dehydrogenase-like enzyme
VATLAGALGMRVVACDPRYSLPDPPSAPIPLMDVEDVFRCSDAVTLHCPLTNRTRGTVDRKLLAAGKRGKVLVNASRGELVDEHALLQALNDGWVSAVGLDVFPSEPPHPSNALIRHPRVVCTPHVVGLSRSWNTCVFTSLADDVGRVLDGVAPIHIANPQVFDSLH